ncbi:MAG: hypothetical protein NXI31_22350 [bacterium]|nr:hypothetical protein [bacterium]
MVIGLQQSWIGRQVGAAGLAIHLEPVRQTRVGKPAWRDRGRLRCGYGMIEETMQNLRHAMRTAARPARKFNRPQRSQGYNLPPKGPMRGRHGGHFRFQEWFGALFLLAVVIGVVMAMWPVVFPPYR